MTDQPAVPAIRRLSQPPTIHVLQVAKAALIPAGMPMGRSDYLPKYPQKGIGTILPNPVLQTGCRQPPGHRRSGTPNDVRGNIT